MKALKNIGLIAFVILIQFKLFAEENHKYWVFFSDKNRLSSVHESYSDFYDIPVNPIYLEQIENLEINIKTLSNWLNAVVVCVNDTQIEQIKKLNFVTGTCIINSYTQANTSHTYKTTLTRENIDLLHAQTEHLGASVLKENNLNGSGIRIAILDAGFMGVDKSPVFNHLFDENRIIATYDFVKNKEYVYAYNQHGTMVLSCIAGKYNNIHMGLATGAQYLLARTEVLFETVSEEENWVAALEWAYKNDAKIINSSLGYTYHKYFPYQMDGKTSVIARAADIAIKKGMLIVNAAGNDGDRDWHIISTPADAEHVLTVGGIDPNTRFHINFSSYGPTADFRIKPNICAFGETIVANSKKLRKAYGTSFAAPLISGFTACIWQLHPEYTAEQIFSEIQKSANLYPYFDYAHGYGTPQIEYFFAENNLTPDPTFTTYTDEDIIAIHINDSTNLYSSYNYLYYHIQDSAKHLKKYSVIKVNNMQPLTIVKKEYKYNDSIVFHYKGYTYGISNK